MGDPQRAAPVIHITGTNGKGSTAQIVTRLLVAQGLTVGTYTSPHLERVNERIDPQRRAHQRRGARRADRAPSPTSRCWPACEPSYFEIVTAAAFRWFADIAVDVMVRRGRPARPVGRHQRRRRPGRGRDQRRRRPPRVRRPDAGRRGRREGRHREARQHARPRRDRPRAGGHLPRRRRRAGRASGAWTSTCVENQLALGGRLLDAADARRRSTPSCTSRSTAGTRATTPPPRSTAVEASSTRRWPRTWWRRPSPRSGCPGASRCSATSRSSSSTAPTTRRAPTPAPACCSRTSTRSGKKILVVGFLAGRDPQAMLEALRADEMDAVICCTPSTSPGHPGRRRRAGGARASAATTSSYTDDVGRRLRRRARPGPAPTTWCWSPARSTSWAHARPHLLARIP